jgi:hypothetical protein
MAWVKIDDHFDEHPKWDNAPGDSIALWLAAMAWCNRSDERSGRIPETKTRGLVNVRNHKATIADLVKRGVFHRVDGGFLIHDYEEFQQNEKVKAIRAKRSEAGKAGARSRWADKRKANATVVPSNPMANGQQDDGNDDAPGSRVPLVTGSTENSPPLTPGRHDDGLLKKRRQTIAEGFARIELERAKGIRSVSHFTASKIQEALDNPRLASLLELFPKAPDDVLAAALLGETHSLGNYVETDPLPERPEPDGGLLAALKQSVAAARAHRHGAVVTALHGNPRSAS